ncbi:diguanylate cyclase [Gluconacetobacter sp. 1b LMG 1731]|uniref:diguanylate cyclase n=1 Tax=Gluconacetobacter dulcium TaxID=2729096 RepID=A0A7W4IJ21_9PROT|nr:diguanylate cyclase [Gluconacetobacter dulcium]MBB2163732.1 diguanylate cyclase [Gluconacetobacter dulcium]MBB2192854.1 diguanylate cyclase [Gluconacetobacter dulcium]
MTAILAGRNSLSTILTCVVWCLVAIASVGWTRHGGSSAMIWPANAVLVASALCMRNFDWRLFPPLLLVLSTLVNLGDHRPWVTSVGFAGANLVEILLAVFLARRFSPISDFFEHPGWAFRFALVTAMAVICSAAVAAEALYFSEGRGWLGGATTWTMAHLPGVLITVPVLLALNPYDTKGNPDHDSPSSLVAGGLMALVAGAAIVVYGQAHYPFQFLLLPPLLLATYHLYAKGAALAVAIIAMIGSYFIFTDVGPAMPFHGPDSLRIYIFQLDLATIFFCALPLGAVLTQRDQKAALAERRLRDFRHLADRVGDVLFRVDAFGRWSYLNPASEQLFGVPVEYRLGQHMLESVIPEDRPPLSRALSELVSGSREDLRQVVSICRRDGTIRHVEILAHRLDEDLGYGGLIRDITEQFTQDEQNRRIAEANEHAANTDELTGLPNRRAFFQALHACMAQDAAKIAVAIFDLDHFKLVNDRYGHPIGDIVLQRVASTVLAAVRDGDMVARIGGEEFAVLITDQNPEQAISLARRLVRAVSSDSIVVPSGPTLHVTISMGIACHRPDEDHAALIERADQALYVAKRGGRNRLMIAEDTLTEQTANGT